MKIQVRQIEANDAEAGFMLVFVVVLVALILIGLALAAPVVAKDIRRDKEIESQHRMQQYVRAVTLFTKHGKGPFPPSIKALENTNNVRYLRHQYVDPLTGKADYKLIHQGEQKTKIHVFFGQELAGLAASLGSAAGLASPGGTGATAGSTTTISAGGLAGGFNGASYGSSGSSGSIGSTGSTGSTGGLSGFGDGTGGVIVGVGTSKTGTSVSEPNGQDAYEKWEFWYDPRIELLKAKVSLTGGGMTSQSASSFGTDINGNSNGASGSTGVSGTSGSTGNTGPFGRNPF